jgi:hypothetical protein
MPGWLKLDRDTRASADPSHRHEWISWLVRSLHRVLSLKLNRPH